LNAARSPNFQTWVTSNLISDTVESSSVVVGTTVKPTAAPATLVPKASTLAASVVAAPKASSTGNGKIPSSCAGAGSPVFSVRLNFLIFRSGVSYFAYFGIFFTAVLIRRSSVCFGERLEGHQSPRRTYQSPSACLGLCRESVDGSIREGYYGSHNGPGWLHHGVKDISCPQ
jgi:hypothetical protein